MTNDLYRSLGNIEAGMATMQENQAKAEGHRKRLDGRLDNMERTLQSVQSDLSDIKPIASQMKQARSYVVAGFIIIASFASVAVWLGDHLAKFGRWLGKF